MRREGRCRWRVLRRWRRVRLGVVLDLWRVLLGLVLGLVVRHLEVVVVVLGWKPSEAGFRCALLGGRLVLLCGQLLCSWVSIEYSHSLEVR